MSNTHEAKSSPLPEGGTDSIDGRQSNATSSTDISARAPPSSSHTSGEIVYHYLAHDTELPPMSFPLQNMHAQSGAPMPNLSKYRDPFTWSPARKNTIVWLGSVATAFTAFTAGAYAPGVPQMSAEWHISRVACLTGITSFTCGFGFAPMVLAPFSELNGRRPVFIATGILFALSQMCCALTHTFGGMVVSRFFVGVGGSTFSTLVGGCVSDIYYKQVSCSLSSTDNAADIWRNRNTPMAIFSGGVFVGTGLGPICAGLIAQHASWRWIFWMQFITDSLLMVAVILFFAETRGSVLLSRKAHALNKWYERCEADGSFAADIPATIDTGVGTEHKLKPDDSRTSPRQRIRWKTNFDEERGSLAEMIAISLFRPFHFLFTEPVVFFFSLWVSFSWAVLYLFFSAITLVMSVSYGFDIAQSGAVFTSITIGGILATVLSIYQEDWAIKGQWGKRWPSPFQLDFSSPEGRLYFACIESLFMPIGMFMFGWTCFPSIHWIVPCIAIAITTIGIFVVYLATFNYLADTYHRYASSALAAQSFCRNFLGGAAPLFTAQMYTAMGFGGASSLLGGCGILLSFVPWVLALYGPRIRARNKFASEVMSP